MTRWGFFAVLLLLPRAVGAADQTLPTKLLILKPSSPLTKVISKPTTPMALPTPGGSDDPTLVGGSVGVCKPPPRPPWLRPDLPFANWKGLGNPPGLKGYKYRGAGTLADPCRVVLVKPRILKAVCKQVDPQFTQPVGTDVVWDLLLGTTARFCGETTGGTIVKDDTRVFKAKDAPAPGVCSSPSGAFLVPPASTLF
jgi:hypothetical protein